MPKTVDELNKWYTDRWCKQVHDQAVSKLDYEHEHNKCVKALGKDKRDYQTNAMRALTDSKRQTLPTSSVVAVEAWLRKNGGSDLFWALAK